MIPGMEMMACPNLSVSAEVMQHIVNVESGKNPFAIGVVGGQLVRQPQNLGEAIATAQMLESKGYNYSLGIAQVNRNNLGKYGLDSYDKAFSVCGNLEAGSRILAECYNNSGGDWGKAFSCYYSGNFTTGYRAGHVKKVFDSINRAANVAVAQPAAAIPLAGDAAAATPRVVAMNQVTVVPTGAAYRQAIRSQALDTALNAMVTPAVASAFNGRTSPITTPQPAPESNSIQQMMQQVAVANGQPPATNGAPASGNAIQQMMTQVQAGNPPAAPNAAQAAASESDVFVPQVRGPNDPVPTQPAPAPMQAQAVDASSPSSQALPQPNVDQADMRKGGSDDAFVF